MYYLLSTGRIVSEMHLKLAFEITHGEKADDAPVNYYDWRESALGIEEAICDENITVQRLLKGDALVDAVKLYSKMYDCTLKEAREAVMEIKMEMGL